MPTITQAPIRGFAHCRNPRCSGNNQEEVDAIQQTESYSFIERGGDLPGEENSIVRVNFAHNGVDPNTGEYNREQDESLCPHCGLVREVSADPRPSYQGEWGQQDFLLDIEVGKDGTRFDPSKTVELQAAASEKLAEENAELRERLARLEGFMMGKQQEQQVESQEPEGD